jgi:hypothetical protein
LKNSVFWDITPCSPLKVNQCLDKTCRLHLQSQRISQPRNFCLLPASNWFLVWIIIQHWRWKWHVSSKHWLNFNRLHGNISQKTEPFITTAVRTSNLYFKVVWTGNHNGEYTAHISYRHECKSQHCLLKC